MISPHQKLKCSRYVKGAIKNIINKLNSSCIVCMVYFPLMRLTYGYIDDNDNMQRKHVVFDFYEDMRDFIIGNKEKFQKINLEKIS
jgi:hypothetical protein